MEVLIGLAGVIIGAGLASGYAFWDVRRSELARGVVAAHALHIELDWLNEELRPQQFRWDRSLEVDSAVSVWREQRAHLVLLLEYSLFCSVAQAFQDVQSLASKPPLEEEHVPADKADAERGRAKAVGSIEKAQPLLRDLRERAETEHNTFILTTLRRGVRDTLIGRSGPLPLLPKGSEQPGSRVSGGFKVLMTIGAVVACVYGVLGLVSLVEKLPPNDPITTGDVERELREMEPDARLARCQGSDAKDRWTCTVAERPCASVRQRPDCDGTVRAESRLAAVGDESDEALYFTVESVIPRGATSSRAASGRRARAWYRRMGEEEPPANVLAGASIAGN